MDQLHFEFLRLCILLEAFFNMPIRISLEGPKMYTNIPIFRLEIGYDGHKKFRNGILILKKVIYLNEKNSPKKVIGQNIYIFIK